MKVRFWQALCIVILAWIVLFTSARAREIVWTDMNPAFAGATFVQDTKICATCHEESIGKYQQTAHGRTFKFGPQGDLEAGNCETCHGPRSKHVEDPDASLVLSASQYAEVCLQCHQGGNRMYWQSGLHKAADVSCVSCHTVMEKRSDTGLLSKAEQPAVCSSCHADVRAEMQKSSHHPVREGRMNCSSCHNPHGTPGRGMLAMGTVNETCYTCHQEKRGPFLWEHPPVREDCLNCHKPHGSTNRNLLTTMSASQCVTCHQYGGHVNQFRYNRVSTPYGNGCVNCHFRMHGSNHPSGAKFTR